MCSAEMQRCSRKAVDSIESRVFELSQNTRATAAKLLAPVLCQKGALNIGDDKSTEGALLRELCYGSLRLYPRLQLILHKLLAKPLKDRDADIQALLILGLYQLLYMRVPDHAVLDQTVGATIELKKRWAKGLVNAVLRNALRKKEQIAQSLADNIEYQSAHPAWLANEIQQSWPEQAHAIFAASNERPPMVLRVNQLKTSTEAYLQELNRLDIQASTSEFANCALRLKSPVPVSALPGFDEGHCSVQDEAAQWAAKILAPESGHRVLDACAAPGGKTCHLLESCADIELTAIELDEKRCASIDSNLSRLGLSTNVVCADAADTKSWWDNARFDRILIDAPCSGTGVIRRHPDIKLLRRPSDIESFAKQQARLLDALWPLLAEDGLLLYVTCSIMQSENEMQMQDFLKRHPNASAETIGQGSGLKLPIGLQSLPTINGPDGFYFALIRKS